LSQTVYQPYRSLGLGTFAIKQILETASAIAAKPRLSSIYLHVQVSNGDAKRFYERNGFKEVGVVESYYKKIEPKAAWLMEWENPPLPPGTVVESAEKPAAKIDEKPSGKGQGKGKKGKGR
jgi:N-alpha-acetyltransferase 50